MYATTERERVLLFKKEGARKEKRYKEVISFHFGHFTSISVASTIYTLPFQDTQGTASLIPNNGQIQKEGGFNHPTSSPDHKPNQTKLRHLI